MESYQFFILTIIFITAFSLFLFHKTETQKLKEKIDYIELSTGKKATLKEREAIIEKLQIEKAKQEKTTKWIRVVLNIIIFSLILALLFPFIVDFVEFIKSLESI